MPKVEPGNITLDKIETSLTREKAVDWHVLRLDKIHPVISGNKWFKLKYYLQEYRKGNYIGIVTFGGAWSNHIVATACVCDMEKIPCIGIIRGEQPAQLSTTLQQASNYGMQLEYISRTEYSDKHNIARPGYLLIPEGGAGEPGERGAAEILDYVDRNHYTHFIMAHGTGTMLRGIAKSLHADQTITGISVLKGINEDVRINTHYHFGGYAKYTDQLVEFMNQFYHETGIPTDFVYTGKLMFAINDLIHHDHFAAGSRILSIHSGGLQGNSSLPKGMLIF